MASVDPVAQQVEHNTFNVGVPGSSPGGITEEVSDNRMIVRDFFCLSMRVQAHHCPQKTSATQSVVFAIPSGIIKRVAGIKDVYTLRS